MGCFVQRFISQGFDAIREHTGDDHDRNIMVPFGGKPPGSEGPGRNRLPTVPFGDKIIGVVNRSTGTGGLELLNYFDIDSLFSFTGSLRQFTENFGSLPASPPIGGNFRSHSLPTTKGKPSQEAKSVATKEPKGEARRAHGIWPTKHANGGKLPHGRKLPSSLLSKCRNFRLNREGTSPEELSRTATSEPRSKVDGNKGAEEAICAISALPPQRTSSRCCSRSNVVTSDPTGREGCRRRQGRTATKGTKKRAAERRSPSQPASSFVASDQNVVASDPKEREVVERAESNGSEGVERGERERMKCGSLSPRSFLPSIANDVRSWGMRRRRANDVRRYGI
ncbi:hypothetical protein M5K25_021927 [Dendrobium thyrsiflorum]|uniref:Uncharacterized protein n=1 Tax=Dendrobium thyrsiflorum TaxID=117978 RepID=A0ABD0UB39_DENTH